ncbi:TlpA family protein disulfide reductase [Chitinophaga oryzae]|uniref:TlpA family protein disulfide reductase n=1 Tax=Chitinophaga oryzae TaxID=2725414 RepID=A0AAE6ZF41_9BACT|nr:TlpA disulfide reductase family protein [Chitinophaga oryzae]QJB31506.1 TlpA family protein disulfide reductase [Chitinophaga oryzae]
MRKLLPALMMVGLATGAAAQSNIVIKGAVRGDLKGYHKVYVFGDGIKEDSVEMKDGRFTISIPWVKDAIPYLYSAYDAKMRSGPPAFPVVVDGPGTIYIDLADVTKGLRSGAIRGNRSATAFQAFEKGREQLKTDLRAAVNERFRDKPKNDSTSNKAFLQLMQQRLIPYITNFVETNADAYIGAFILGRYQVILPPDDLERLYNKLGPAQKASAPAKEVAARLNGMKKAVTGAEVTDFTLDSPEDKSITFSSFRGKYVLIDFWASWCGPCKASFPYMKQLYQQYRGDKFEIVGISIDQEKAAWLNELKKQELPWPQVLDTKKVSVNSFAVTAVPTAYLIGPDGKILMKQIGMGEEGNGEIEKKLKELFAQ